MEFTPEEITYLKKIAQKGLGQEAYDNKVAELDAYRQELYAEGKKTKPEIDSLCKSLEDEAISLRPIE